jgi:hypothetical protein
MAISEKILTNKDDQGREQRVTAKNERGDFWRITLEHPDGLRKTMNVHGSDGAVEARMVQLAAENRLEFKQARNRGDQRPGMKPDLSIPVPADPPIGYGTYEVKR